MPLVPLVIGLIYGIGLVTALVLTLVRGDQGQPLDWFWWVWGVVAVVWSWVEYRRERRLKDFNQWGR